MTLMTLTYDDALDYLYGLINYELQRPDRYAPDVVSLDRPRALLSAFGNPQETFPILHLTGTKGKGSVSAMSASALAMSGVRVGLYSSPHLQDFRERFQINGALIPPATLADLVTRLRPVIESIPGLTWFEVITAIAFLYFAEAKVDVAVIEVGLGGRLDATNIVRAPLVSTITSLSYDHMHLLGNTLAEIAFEKAGIIKAGVPVVSAPQPEEALAVIRRIAAERNAPLTVVGDDLLFSPTGSDEYGQAFTANRPGSPPTPYWTPLLGAHQALNGAVALATLSQLGALSPSPEAVQRGLALVNWAGRLEVVRRTPWLVLDVAHNSASADRLRHALLTNFPNAKRRMLIFGALKDKDVRGMFAHLLPITDHLIVMEAITPRAFATADLVAFARESGFTGTIESRSAAAEALAYAESLATRPDDLVCVTGSLSVVGEARTVLKLTPARASYLDEPIVKTRQNTARITHDDNKVR
ncbi:MAG TPA: folylpolyglutamate synthase/dihydrofolate synthase family protein [Aggregatilineales bacterium]|nr:bifunctional folylpolyglutamate synthase/dihydrofolate synthase [Anaerolineales bacterium]HRE49239.1 folylpolyglutamate synthase/dihydrofolate synthase family protein [Aggregatilineales bacterium]